MPIYYRLATRLVTCRRDDDLRLTLTRVWRRTKIGAGTILGSWCWSVLRHIILILLSILNLDITVLGLLLRLRLLHLSAPAPAFSSP